MIRKDIKETIRDYFFVNPNAKLRVRRIERTLELPLPSVIKYCKELKEEGILTTTKTGDVVFYTSNRANEGFLMEKKLFNLKQIHASGIVGCLRDELSNPVIILFGSYSKGEDTENSDIDLYLETPSKKAISFEKFEKVLQRKIQVFRHKNIREIGNIGLANNIVNGIVLNGFIEVFK
ncbi:MAG: nucleotidyltransferase domain-containing protein [Candidatus Aenigmarchaeota archaeon]|nr:nucleotidyltransferase domain-containing protein [Candidatus Aenigmarchaeota archaeon]